MKNTIYLVLLLCTQCGGGPFRFTGNAPKDVEAMLKPGTHMAFVMDSLVLSDRQRALEMVWKESIRENYAWYIQYLDSFGGVDPLPYHPNFGVIEEDYQELLRLRKEVNLVASSSQNINIEKKDHVITFKAGGRLEILDKIKIDTRSNTVQVGNYVLNFTDTVHITNANHGLKTTWDGYSWRFSDPEGLKMSDIKDTENLTAKHYKITVGHLERTNQTILSVTIREMISGESMTNIDLPIVF